MIDRNSTARTEPSLRNLERALAACDRYEADLKAGRAPRIEDCLVAADPSDRKLFVEMLVELEVSILRSRKQRPLESDYRRRFPDDAAAVSAAFACADPPATDAATVDDRASRALSRRKRTARELFFGLLAEQNGFIEPRALIETIHAWIEDKSRSIAELLVSAGRLKPDEREILESLVNQHISQHKNTEECLQKMPRNGNVIAELVDINDDDVEAVSSLLVAGAAPDDEDDDDTDPERTLPHRSAESPSVGPRDRFVRLILHRKGGLGLVYKAVDTELRRNVALKEIRQRYADDEQSRARFIEEARITGKLEHPGVVPVYGLGLYADGRPYYAMRFIKGESLTEYRKRMDRPPTPADAELGPPPTLRGMLARFVQICRTIEYAHSRGVLHRDLKPSNLMFGKFGETLVVDWGVAKRVGRRLADLEDNEGIIPPSVDSNLDATHPHAAPGTIEYMSPEQAKRAPLLVGAASDVYSLGAVLYFIIVGKPAFHREDDTSKSWAETRDKVLAGDFPRPCSLNPRIDRGLEAICLKAMAFAPDQRYPSAELLARDVEAWLDDRAIVARPDGLASAALRAMRKRLPIVLAAAAALFTGTVGLGLVLAVELKREADLSEAKLSLRSLSNNLIGHLVNSREQIPRAARTRMGIYEERFRANRGDRDFFRKHDLIARTPLLSLRAVGAMRRFGIANWRLAHLPAESGNDLLHALEQLNGVKLEPSETALLERERLLLRWTIARYLADLGDPVGALEQLSTSNDPFATDQRMQGRSELEIVDVQIPYGRIQALKAELLVGLKRFDEADRAIAEARASFDRTFSKSIVRKLLVVELALIEAGSLLERNRRDDATRIAEQSRQILRGLSDDESAAMEIQSSEEFFTHGGARPGYLDAGLASLLAKAQPMTAEGVQSAMGLHNQAIRELTEIDKNVGGDPDVLLALLQNLFERMTLESKEPAFAAQAAADRETIERLLAELNPPPPPVPAERERGQSFLGFETDPRVLEFRARFESWRADRDAPERPDEAEKHRANAALSEQAAKAIRRQWLTFADMFKNRLKLIKKPPEPTKEAKGKK